jgi:hypothetical protein
VEGVKMRREQENIAYRKVTEHCQSGWRKKGVPLGLLGQEIWIRDPQELGNRHRRYERPFSDKESAKWVRSLQASTDPLDNTVATVTIGEREADIFELFASPRPANADLLIRACRERLVKVEAEVKRLWNYMLASPVRGQTAVKLEATRTRKARTASCSIHFEKLSVLAPKRSKRKEPHG